HMIKGDFRRFEGNWIMRDLEKGTSLFYELTVQGCIGMPVGLIEQRLRDDLAANLLAVEKEALRRHSLV
ncbi:MAG: SRPBCC family protein, partial [Prochlorococcaceae cyanobacterium ETNP2_MAG_10]|nr:SRPBCC family protein [Prochlorococcaceae cyanobacterium ETNP2_MAG_10]